MAGFNEKVFAREIIISFPDNPDMTDITGENIVSESLKYEEAICDGNFKFGGCISSKFEISLLNVNADDLIGKRISVNLKEHFYGNKIFPQANLSPAESLYPGSYFKFVSNSDFFVGTIDSAKRQKDKKITKIVAYDDLYTIGSINCYEWFENICLYNPTVKVGTLFEQVLDNPFINMSKAYNSSGIKANATTALSLTTALARDICDGELLASELLNNLCELIGNFGYISGETFILQGLSDEATEISSYKDLDYEDYVTNPFNVILCKYNKDKWHWSTTTSAASPNPSTYSIDNALSMCNDNKSVAVNLCNGIWPVLGTGTGNKYQYRPFKCVINDPSIKLGAKVKIPTGDSVVPYVESYVFKRSIEGINGMLVTISADGDKQQIGNYEIN